VRRRHWLMAGVAGAAAVSGAGLGWWRWRLQDPLQVNVAEFWQQRWPGPDGAPVEMGAWRGRPLLLNFWATWCPPCVEELPLLNTFYRAQQARGWGVLGVAVDRAEAVRPFLRRLPLDFPVAVAGMAGVEWTRRLGNPQGGLPFTVLFDGQGQIVQRKIGQLRADDLTEWAAQLS